MAHVSLEKCLAVIEKPLHKEACIRDVFQATHYELETQMDELRLEIFIVVKIQTKVVTNLEVYEREVKKFDTFLVEEQVAWFEEKEHIDELSKSLQSIQEQLPVLTSKVGGARVQAIVEYCDSIIYVKDTLDIWIHGFHITKRWFRWSLQMRGR